MGFKRPFDEEEFQGFSLKHPKQVDCGNKLTSFTETYPCHEPTQKADIKGEGEGLFSKSQLSDGFEHERRNMVLDIADKEFEISAPSSWVTNSTGAGKEDATSGTTVWSSISPGYFEFYLPRESSVQFEPTYSSLWDGSPKRQVHVGPSHQADVPEWDPQAKETYCINFDRVGDAGLGKLMGDCIFLMPDTELSAHSGVKAGDGRKERLCLDQGSVRCVRQHVREARERVRETLGLETFMQLGFCDMGEEVSLMWTEQEQRVFHEVVYSNPVSHGRNFWEHLSAVFPSRTKKEIVSYYFNVFMLRRRAIQNRSNFLDIDSDDDEWHGSDRGPVGVAQEDEDSAFGSLVVQDICVDHGDDSPDDDDDDSDGDNDENDDEGDSDDCDGGSCGENTTGNDGGTSLLSEAQDTSGENSGDKNVSSITFDCQPHLVNTFGSADRSDVQEGGTKSDSKEGLHGNDQGADGLGPSYWQETSYAQVWDARYPMSPLKGVDLLSTRNMMEEIFGSCAPNNKSSDDVSVH